MINPELSPCIECKNRQVGCHSTCNGYLKWSKNIRKLHEKERIARRNKYGDNPRFKGQY